MGRKRSKEMKKLVKMTRCLQFAFALLLTVGLVAVFATTTKAAAPKPAGVKQVDATESSVKITWNTVMADKAYLWYKISDTHYAATWLLHPDAPKIDPPKIVLERIEKMRNRRKDKDVTQ